MLMRPYVQIAPPTNYKKNFTIDDRYSDNWYNPAFSNVTVSNWYVSWGYWNSDFDAFTWTQICRIQNDMESLQVWHTLEMWFKFLYWYQNWVNMSMLPYWDRWITVWTYWDAMNVKMQVRVDSSTNQTIYYADNIPFVENQLITIAIKTFDNWSWWCLTRYYMNWIELANDSTWIWPSQKVVQQPHVEMWWNMESQVSIDYVDYALPVPTWTYKTVTTTQGMIDDGWQWWDQWSDDYLIFGPRNLFTWNPYKPFVASNVSLEITAQIWYDPYWSETVSASIDWYVWIWFYGPWYYNPSVPNRLIRLSTLTWPIDFPIWNVIRLEYVDSKFKYYIDWIKVHEESAPAIINSNARYYQLLWWTWAYSNISEIKYLIP